MGDILEAYEERRKYKRYKSFLAGLVNSQLIFIEDISKGGMRILSAEYIGKIGDIITIDSHMPNDRLENMIFKAKIAWVKEIDGDLGYFTGVEFISEDNTFEHNITHLLNVNNYLLDMRQKYY